MPSTATLKRSHGTPAGFLRVKSRGAVGNPQHHHRQPSNLIIEE
ncbi:MAG TPA: hypothetical protein ACFE0H_07365 [Elainellaceae cyanobacterium]